MSSRPDPSAPLLIGILIGGGGRTMLNLADRINDSSLDARIAIVIATQEDLPGVRRAQERGLPVTVVDRRAFDSASAFHDAMTAALVGAGVELVCLAGYLRWFRVDEPFRNRVINIHPALLPDFGGSGMYGQHVHEAVIESGAAESGCTVHFVDEKYDHGPIILQKRCPTVAGEDASQLAARVFLLECEAYPAAVQLFAQGRLQIRNAGVEILPEPAGR